MIRAWHLVLGLVLALSWAFVLAVVSGCSDKPAVTPAAPAPTCHATKQPRKRCW